MSSTRTQALTRTSSSAISMPSTIVSATFAAVKTTVRSERVPEDCRRAGPSGSCRSPMPTALVADQLEQPVLLEREPDEPVERVAEDRRRSRSRPPAGSARTAPRLARAAPARRRRRRDGPKSVPAASPCWLVVRALGYDWFSTDAMLSLADVAACLIDSLPVRICASMLRRMLPFSTSTQCFAVGTNQLRDGSALVDARAEQVGRVRDVALRLQALLAGVAREVRDPVGRERLVRARRRDGEVGAAEEARHRLCPRRGPASRTAAVDARVLSCRRSS